MKTLFLLTAASAIALATPAVAQTMDHSNMPGMKMPAKPAPAAKPNPDAKPRAATPQRGAPRLAQDKPTTAPVVDACPPEHAAMGHCKPEGATSPEREEAAADPEQRVGGAQDPAPSVADSNCPPEHAEMGHCVPQSAGTSEPDAMQDMAMPMGEAMGSLGTALPAGDAPAPAAPEPDYADRVWGATTMQPARDALRREHGGGRFSQVMIDLAEIKIADGHTGYKFEADAWFGGDINRFVFKADGEGEFGEPFGDVELKALYSRAIGPYFNLQAGVRQDLGVGPDRTHAVIGIEGLAPYWFEVDSYLYLSTQGEVRASASAEYDQRLTQRLILQPKVEFDLSAQDIPEIGIGSGLTSAEFGLRLRYEIAREFAPYIGIVHEAKFGRTADFARAAGDDPSSTNLVVGVRAWF